MDEQNELFDAHDVTGEQTPPKAAAEAAGGRPAAAVRVKPIDRRQLFFRSMDVDALVGPAHPVRAIWELVGRLDLSAFYQAIEAVEGEAGRPATDPKLLVSLWIYAYSRGVSSAREVARLCAYHPAYQWLTGAEAVSYHTLSSFRVQQKEALDALFRDVLGVLSADGLIKMKRVTQDGTKVRACASSKSFRREERLAAHRKMAEEQIAAMGDPREEQVSQRTAQARARALRERRARLERAAEELQKIREKKDSTEEKQQARVSTTDPEARVMKQGDGGFGPSYNVQTTTDTEARVVLAVAVSQAGEDSGELLPALERVEQNVGRKPEQVIADGGYTNRKNIVAMEERGVELIGSLERAAARQRTQGVGEAFLSKMFVYDPASNTFRCPAGETLRAKGKKNQPGATEYYYRAEAAACQVCAHHAACCPKTAAQGRLVVRVEEDPRVVAFRQKMETAEAKAVYKQRAEVAEFPHAWLKEKIGLRRFRLRGLIKVGMEALWACLAYNIEQWIRLRPLAQAA